MELIQDSTEHYFLTRLEALKSEANHWYGLYFSLSKTLGHSDLVSDLAVIADKIQTARSKSNAFAQELQNALKDGFEGSICVFADTDVFALVKVQKKEDVKALEQIFKTMAAKLPQDVSDMDMLGGQYKTYQKIADDKLLSVRRYDGYQAMADKHKVASISARRKRRDEPLVMLVEDDRFTAHYASTILSADFDLVTCKDGEEAVEAYIKNAPDIVFLDIHLPGLSGHEVLQAIYAVDPQAFVVMLSVDSVRENIVKASKMGARKFLKKPFTKERLIDTVKSSPFVRAMMRTDQGGNSTTMLH